MSLQINSVVKKLFEKIQTSLDKNKKDLEMLKKEYNDYKDKMQPYENLPKIGFRKEVGD